MSLKTQEGFQAWKDSPLTKEFLQYLKDRQQDLCLAWGVGKTLTVEQQAQAVLLNQLAGISWDEIVEQYKIEVSDGQTDNEGA